jgi:hypothetical protein
LGKDSQGDESEVNVVSLIDAVAGRDHNVQVPGSNFVLEQKDVTEAIRAAVLTGIKDKKREDRQADRLEAPGEAVKIASREVKKAHEALKTAVSDPDFDIQHRKTLEANFKKLQRSLRSFETALNAAGITGT